MSADAPRPTGPDVPHQPSAGGGPDPSKASAAREYGRASAAAWEFAGALVLCTLAGLWIDRKFGIVPWATVGGALLGFVAGFLTLVARLELLGPKRPKGGASPDGPERRDGGGG